MKGEGIWKFSPLLPIDNTTTLVSLGEGSTPYRALKKVGIDIKFENLFMKFVSFLFHFIRTHCWELRPILMSAAGAQNCAGCDGNGLFAILNQ